MTISASRRPQAERAAEWYAVERMGCVVTRRAVRVQYQSVDFFGSDIVGKTRDGAHVYIQVTAGGNSAVSARRRKLEAIPWHTTDRVQLLQLVQTHDPANGRRKLWFFRVHNFALKRNARVWTTESDAVPVPADWFSARSRNDL